MQMQKGIGLKWLKWWHAPAAATLVLTMWVVKENIDKISRAPIDNETVAEQKKAPAPVSSAPQPYKEVSNANILPIDPSGDGEAGDEGDSRNGGNATGMKVPGGNSPENQATDVASGQSDYDYLIDALDMKKFQYATNYLLTIVKDKSNGQITCLYEPMFGNARTYPVVESEVVDLDKRHYVAAKFSYREMALISDHGEPATQHHVANVIFRIFDRGAEYVVVHERKHFLHSSLSYINYEKLAISPY